MRLAIKVGLVCGLSSIVAGCQSKVATPQPIPVDTTRIQIRDFENVIQAEGTLSDPGYIQLKPQTSGLITQVLVKEGDPVRTGQVLVVLDDAEERADLKTAQAELKESLVQAKRYKKLALVGAVKKEQAELKQIKVIEAQSKVVAKQEALLKRSMRSPIDGIVGDLFGISPGQYLEQGQNNFVVVNNENLSIDLSIPAFQAGRIKLNQKVKMFDVSNSNAIGEGRVSFIPPYFDLDGDTNNYRASNTLRVRAVFVNQRGFRPNQLIRSNIIIGGEEYPGLPATAALFQAQQPYTYKLVPIGSYLKSEDVTPQQKKSIMLLPKTAFIAVNTPLKLGDLQDNYYAVLSGLKAGDLIAVSGSAMLGNGTPVLVKSSN